MDGRPKRIKSLRLLSFAITIVFVCTGPDGLITGLMGTAKGSPIYVRKMDFSLSRT